MYYFIDQKKNITLNNLFLNKDCFSFPPTRKVFYKTPNSMWRFFGYYGGLNAIGNLSSYGQYADDSTFEVIPTWHNKLQAMAYETAIYTRNSHFSYEIKNNKKLMTLNLLFFKSMMSRYVNINIIISLFALIINKMEAGEKKNKK